MTSRRDFLILGAKAAGLLGCTAGLSVLSPLQLLGLSRPRAFAAPITQDKAREAPPARFWTSVAMAGSNCAQCHTPAEITRDPRYVHAVNLVKCLLCAQGCVLRPGESGKCRARKNIDGRLVSLVYGRPITVNIDPIEKKPFYHFLPGTPAYSLATSGCPLKCKFCQNWQISQASPDDYRVSFVPPSAVAGAAVSRNVPVIAFTYNEPTVFTEYMLDIAREARKSRIRSVLISCGFMNEVPLREMCENLSAIKIDLKGYSDKFYRDVCSAELRPVLRSIKQVAKSPVHLEIVNLVVPTLNDSEKMFSELSEWVVGEVGPDVPVHFTRFHPDYQMLNLPPTPVATLERARSFALAKGIHYPYVGNVPDHPGNSTYCPSCNRVVIRRTSFFVLENNVKEGKCAFCGRRIAGVWR